MKLYILSMFCKCLINLLVIEIKSSLLLGGDMILVSPLVEVPGVSPEPDQSQHGHTEDDTDRLPDPLTGLLLR